MSDKGSGDMMTEWCPNAASLGGKTCQAPEPPNAHWPPQDVTLMVKLLEDEKNESHWYKKIHKYECMKEA